VKKVSLRDQLRDLIEARIHTFEDEFGILSGIFEEDARQCFIEQVVDSVHRIQYVDLMMRRTLSPRRANPQDIEFFDPLLASIYYQKLGNLDEAFWLVFVFTHFGRNARGGWRYAREFYGKLNQGGLWDWKTVRDNPIGVSLWVSENYSVLARSGAGFGNHRKYESLSQLGVVIESYVSWIGSNNHEAFINYAIELTDDDPIKTFDFLYRSMSRVQRFGRTAKFDYLTMLGKLKLAPVNPGYVYVAGATGPKQGARYLFGNPDLNNSELEQKFADLERHLQFGMQVIEDSICNWQKSPNKYRAFRL
jgi:hypothetical protein